MPGRANRKKQQQNERETILEGRLEITVPVGWALNTNN